MIRNQKWIMISIIVVLIIILSIFYLLTRKKSPEYIREQAALRKESIVALFEKQRDIFTFLEEEVYLEKDEIMITWEDGELQLPINNRFEESEKEKLKEIFEYLNCQSMHLFKKAYGKVLEISLGNIEIDKRNTFEDSIIYCKDKNKEQWQEIYPNWYYEVLFYTEDKILP